MEAQEATATQEASGQPPAKKTEDEYRLLFETCIEISKSWTQIEILLTYNFSNCKQTNICMYRYIRLYI